MLKTRHNAKPQTVIRHFKETNMRNLILTSTFLLWIQISFGQIDNHSTTCPTYREMLVVNENLFAIDEKGRITNWNLNTLDKEFEMKDTIPKFSTVSSDIK